MLYLPDDEGQGTAEYALLLALVALNIIAILLLLGPQIGDIFSTMTHRVSV